MPPGWQHVWTLRQLTSGAADTRSGGDPFEPRQAKHDAIDYAPLCVVPIDGNRDLLEQQNPRSTGTACNGRQRRSGRLILAADECRGWFEYVKPRKVRGGLLQGAFCGDMSMRWIEPKSNRGPRPLISPQSPAVLVRIYLQSKNRTRVCLSMNPAFVRANRLQPGDRIAIGIDDATGAIGLKRCSDGNAISGKGWSPTRDGKTTKNSHATPYVSFSCTTYPGVDKWAKPKNGQWVLMRDKGTHWESTE